MFWKRRKTAPADWLVVGLGNPGEQYRWTPHNLGFLTIESLAGAAGIRVRRPQENALVGRGAICGRDTVLARPLSYMNRSGQPVSRLAKRYGVDLDRLLVVYDELDLPWGRLRLRQKGSPAGHNGMRSIVESLGTTAFPRLRIGIHPGHQVADGARYVLHPFRVSEREQVTGIVDRAAAVVRDLLAAGAQRAMARCNRPVPEPES